MRQNRRQNQSKHARHSFEAPTVLLPNVVELGPPFVAEVEEKCDECGGQGYDLGSLAPTDAAVCPACRGSGRQIVVRNYLAEALRIAARKTSIPPEREHLEAIIQYCRNLVGAMMSISDGQFRGSGRASTATVTER